MPLKAETRPGDVPSGRPPESPMRTGRMAGLVCLLIGVGWLIATVVMVQERINRDLVAIDGIIASVDTDRTVRSGGRPLVASPFLSVTLTTPRLVDGTLQPMFRFALPIWSGGLAENLAAELSPGDRVSLTVSRDHLDGAVTSLQSRLELERNGGVYNPGPFTNTGIVDVVSIRSSDGQVEARESALGAILVLVLSLLAATLFSVAGLRLLRKRDARPAEAA